jgi:hypothetical protein
MLGMGEVPVELDRERVVLVLRGLDSLAGSEVDICPSELLLGFRGLVLPGHGEVEH